MTIEEISSDALTQTSVYPPEVVKLALHDNAASVLFAHNYLPGIAKQSQEDELITKQLKKVLALVDARVWDHFIVTSNMTLSFAERGLL